MNRMLDNKKIKFMCLCGWLPHGWMNREFAANIQNKSPHEALLLDWLGLGRVTTNDVLDGLGICLQYWKGKSPQSDVLGLCNG